LTFGGALTSRRRRRERHVGCRLVGKVRTQNTETSVGSPDRDKPFEDLGVDGRMLKYTSQK
jgi:hypothetical protein